MLEPFSLTQFGENDQLDWDGFLKTSQNATLYHDIRFLNYHPVERHVFHHLLARRGALVRAVIPGGTTMEDGRQWFNTPLGASVGGPAIAEDCTLDEAEEVLIAFQKYALRQGWSGIKMALAPPAFQNVPSQLLEFALFRRGFVLSHRYATFAVPLMGQIGDAYRTIFRRRQGSFVRAARKKGVTIAFGGRELLEDFLPVFDDTYARLGATPTHSADEIDNLLERFPSRISLCLAKLGAATIAALLLIRINAYVTTAFYICSAAAYSKEHGVATAFAALIDKLGLEGCRYLDLGPSASDEHVNAGVVFFKEGLGAKVFCRDHWVWAAANHDGVRATPH